MIPRKIQQQKMRHIKLALNGLFACILLRAVWIHLFPSSAGLLQHIATTQYQSRISLSPYRGSIYDHRNAPLAISIKAPSVAINPRVFAPTLEQHKALCKLLDLDPKRLQAIVHKQKYFAWLKRKINYKTADKLKKLDIKGLHFLQEPARYYPGGPAASQVLGYVGTDNKGLLGIEYAFEKTLQGKPSQLLSLKDARGQQILMNADAVGPETSGNNIILTLDRVIQEISEEALDTGMKKSEAKRGFVVVMDPHTGRLLAVANRPSFNPNTAASLDITQTENLAISMRFEPGSVMKPFVVAAAIEQGITSPYELHHCEKLGRYKIGNRSYIHDDHPKEFRTTEEVLIYSSNICTYKIAARLGKEALHSTLHKFGFAGPKDFLRLPGETKGSIDAWQRWKELRFANIAFGQGLLVTGLEVAQAYAVLANGGQLVKPFLVERIEAPSGQVLEDFLPSMQGKVISTQTAQIMRHILAKVVTEGSGTKAASSLYQTGGKTGTAEKFDNEAGIYGKDMRIASFAGFAPVKDPYLVVYVVIDEPQKKPYYGGLWAAPVFKDIVERSLKYLNVAPDAAPKPEQSEALAVRLR